MNDTVDVYRMNPAEDVIITGDQLEEGMWVIAADASMRRPYGGSEDDKIRAQRFRRVTRLRRHTMEGQPVVSFVGEWIDGYAEMHPKLNESHAWLVKKAPGEPVVPVDGEARRTPADLALSVAKAIEEAAISDWDADDGKVIEIYVSQIAPIVERVLREGDR